jgi:WD40 repeat protein
MISGKTRLISHVRTDLALCSPLALLKVAEIPFMFQQLEYQERFKKSAHGSTINAMVISPDGRRLVTGSDDATVLVWSTRSGVALCRFKAHSPVLSLAWLRNSKGFIFGCKNGMLASVDITEVCGHESVGFRIC